jgi:hypothetical protein
MEGWLMNLKLSIFSRFVGLNPRLWLMAMAFGWFLYSLVDLRLVFVARDSLFLWNHRFFTDFLGQPGWLLRWFDVLWVQLCFHGWPGAVAMGVMALLLLGFASACMNLVGQGKVGGTWVLPGGFLFYLYSAYLIPSFAILGAMLAMAGAWGWCWLRLRRGCVVGVGGFVLISSVLYYVGGPAVYCFWGCCVADVLVRQSSWRMALALVIAGGVVKLGVDALLDSISPGTGFFHPPSVDVSLLNWKMAVLFAYFPVCAVCVGMRSRVAALRHRLMKTSQPSPQLNMRKGASAKAREELGAAPLQRSPFRWGLGTVVIVAMGLGVGVGSMDRNIKSLVEIDYCADHQLWEELLVKARDLRVYSQFANHDVNLALYHTGRMPSGLFGYPQAYTMLFDQEQVRGGSVSLLRKPCSLLLELGRVNEAEHLAYEMLELCPNGRTLKCLASIKIIKNEPDAARLFLNVLRDDLILGGWAREYLGRLDADPGFSTDAEVRQVRQLMLKKDDLDQVCRISYESGPKVNYYAMLVDLLKTNPRNRMAFEYLMSMYLLDGNVQGVVELLPLVEGFSYAMPPCSYEEAALIYAVSHPGDLTVNASGVFFRNRKMSDATADKFMRLRAIMNQAGGSIERAAPVIARELPGTYFSYFLTQRGNRHAKS